MPERHTRLRRALGWARVCIGPPVLVLFAITQGVRVTGITTVALTHPAPPWTQAVADVLAALALGAMALWCAAALAGSYRPLSLFLVVVASAQLPLAALALVMGRRILGRTVVDAAAGHEEAELLRNPTILLSAITPPAVAALLLTVLVVGVLFVAYRRLTKLSGWRLPVSFLGGVLGAEILCRLWGWWAD
ncbi:MAG: hypothetical protein ACUVX8_06365 [Candidatus Zipacnadales bacterium]